MKNGANNWSLRIKKSVMSKLVLLIFSVIYLSETIEVLLFNNTVVWYEAFALNSSTEGHIQLSLYIILLPLYVIFFYGYKLFLENSNSLVYIYNANRKQYLKEHLLVITKYVVIGLSVLFSIDLAVNIVRNIIIVNYLPSVEIHYSMSAGQVRDYIPFLAWKLEHPMVAVIVYSITTITYTVLMSYIVILLSVIVKNIKDLIIISFAINIIFFISPIYPVGKSIQPFVESDISYFIFGTLSIYLVQMIICFVLYKVYMKGRDYV